MATQDGLAKVTQGEYFQFLAQSPEIVNHPQLRVLAVADPIAWDNAKQLVDSQVVFSLTGDIKSYAHLVLLGKAVEAVLNTDEMTGEKAKFFTNALATIAGYVPTLNVSGEVPGFIGLVAVGILQTTEGSELNQYYAALKYIEENNLYSDIAILKSTIHDRYTYVLSLHGSDSTVPTLKKQSCYQLDMLTIRKKCR